jgi:acetolactate synthase regulatory subunit
VRKSSKKLLAILIVSLILLSAIPLNASAVNVNVDILPGDSVADIRLKIDNAFLTSSVTTVTVNNSGSTAYTTANTTLKIEIPAGVDIIWNATYRGTANPVVDIYGDRTFTVAASGWIQNTSSANSFTTVRANNSTKIVVDAGTVQAGRGRAVEGAGVGTTVTVEGTGAVFNTATNNLFPCIDMTHAENTSLNVTVTGNGTVYSDPDPLGAATVYGYAIQTYGNVLVSGSGEVYTTGRNGRCINLVGMNSNATVTGGNVYATGDNGVAISTSTTNPGQVVNSSVTIEGGLVAVYGTGNSWAIRTTGSNSTVTVSGGCVFGFGTDIQINGTHPTNVPVAAPNNVIFIQGRPAAAGSGYTLSGTGGVIAWDRNAWNTPTHSRAPYNEHARRHITTDPAQTPALLPPAPPPPLTVPYAVWAKNPPGYDGISYNFGGGIGFISLAEVEVSATRTVRVLADSGGEITLPVSGSSPGELDPSGFIIGGVPFDSSVTITFTANPSFTIADIEIINATTGVRMRVPYGLNYTLNSIRHDYIVIAHFNRLPSGYHTVVSFAGDGGKITNPDLVEVPFIAVNNGYPNMSRVINADAGYHIADIRVDGVSVIGSDALDMTEDRSSATYTFPRITRNSVITATFEPNTHTITATANSGGRIIPFGDDPIVGTATRIIAVPAYGNRVFTIVPDPGFYIDRVQLTGETDSARSVYDILITTGNRSIEAFFAQIEHYDHTITATAGSGGRLIPLGRVPGEDPDQAPISGTSRNIDVPDGANQAFRISASSGFRIRDVLVDGVSVGRSGRYEFDEVRADHEIRVLFERLPGESNTPREKSPQTGDDRSVTLPIILLAAGLLVIAVAEFIRRKSKKNKK